MKLSHWRWHMWSHNVIWSVKNIIRWRTRTRRHSRKTSCASCSTLNHWTSWIQLVDEFVNQLDSVTMDNLVIVCRRNVSGLCRSTVITTGCQPMVSIWKGTIVGNKENGCPCKYITYCQSPVTNKAMGQFLQWPHQVHHVWVLLPRRRSTAIHDVLCQTETRQFQSDADLDCVMVCSFLYGQNSLHQGRHRVTSWEHNECSLETRPTSRWFSIHWHHLPLNDEIRKLILSLPAKSSRMDKIPTSVIKSCVDVFSPLVGYQRSIYEFRQDRSHVYWYTSVPTYWWHQWLFRPRQSQFNNFFQYLKFCSNSQWNTFFQWASQHYLHDSQQPSSSIASHSTLHLGRPLYTIACSVIDGQVQNYGSCRD